MPWKLLPCEPTKNVRTSLRRYIRKDDSPCPLPMGYHSAATVVVDEEPGIFSPEGYLVDRETVINYPNTDPRWPTKCACGYVFEPDDIWQVDCQQLMLAVDGQKFTIHDAPVGACWKLWWANSEACNPNNKDQPMWPLAIRLPPGRTWDTWHADGPSRDGTGWPRHGTIDKLTCRPSIACNREGKNTGYHGYVTDGIISECHDGNTYPGLPRTA